MLKKKFVIDTSVLIYDVDCLTKFGENEVIIPSIVYEEINLLKEENSEKGYYARRIVEVLDELSLEKPLIQGVMLGETLIRTSYNLKHGDIEKAFTMDSPDYKILACAKANNAILVSRDKMFRVLARDFVEVQDYQADKLTVKELYKGYRYITVPEQTIAELHTNRLYNEFGLYPNEFAILTSELNSKHTSVGICKGDRIIACDFDNMNKAGVKLKTKQLGLEQKMLMYLMLDDDIKAVSVIGMSGKGKTLQGVDWSLANVFGRKYNQFIYTKSVISVDTKEDLGFYKGSPLDKLKPHIQPLLSSLEHLYKKELYQGEERKTPEMKLDELLAQGYLSVLPLANIRGMSVDEKAVLLDEGQNTTNHMMKTVVTRLKDSSKLLVSGDVDQIDDKHLSKYNNGLSHLIENGKHETFIGHITMDIDNKSKRGLLSAFGSNKL